jgi:hypothetical protein
LLAEEVKANYSLLFFNKIFFLEMLDSVKIKESLRFESENVENVETLENEQIKIQSNEEFFSFIKFEINKIENLNRGEFIGSYSDMLICYSTMDGYVSWRNPIYGSWFGCELINVLQTFSTYLDLETMLKQVMLNRNNYSMKYFMFFYVRSPRNCLTKYQMFQMICGIIRKYKLFKLDKLVGLNIYSFIRFIIIFIFIFDVIIFLG